VSESQTQRRGTPSKISVQTVMQGNAQDPFPLIRQQHWIAAGTSIRSLLLQAGLEAAIAQIEAGQLGLACHGRRAWLDDILGEGVRVEIVEAIHADAKASRAERVAEDRRRRQSRFGAKG
jgi:putative ubiquitin-RnfH superfamily antitoxin RatB of RatAB toxin-antitoxin module